MKRSVRAEEAGRARRVGGAVESGGGPPRKLHDHVGFVAIGSITASFALPFRIVGAKQIRRAADTEKGVRAPRAYLAGFGTSGSLLAGAALIFLLASAFVAFHGWPQVGETPSTAAVSLSSAAPRGSSPASRALHSAVGGPGTAGSPGAIRALLSRHAGRTATSGGLAGTHSGGTTSHGRTVVQSGISPSSGSGSSGPGTPSTQGCVGSSCTSPASPSGGPVSTATGVVHKTVSTAGSALNSAVNTVTKHLPTGAGNTVSTVTSSVTNTVSTVTKKVPVSTPSLP